jgi:hypothetical protein
MYWWDEILEQVEAEELDRELWVAELQERWGLVCTNPAA